MAWALDDARYRRPVQRARQGSELPIQGRDRAAVDGFNTQNRWYNNASDIDARQKILCDNAKAPPNNITIYAVQVDTGGDGQQSVMKYCASSPDKYFHVTTAGQTTTVFSTIGTSLSKLRVAK